MSRRDLRDTLVAAREAAGLTQVDLATACRVSSQQVSRWERGTAVPGAKVLARLAETLGLDAGPLYQLAISASQEDAKQIRRDANRLADQFRDAYELIHKTHVVMTERIETLSKQIEDIAETLDDVRNVVHKQPGDRARP